MAFVCAIQIQNNMITQKLITPLFAHASETLQLLRNAYGEIQQEPIIISLHEFSNIFQKTAALYQQCNSKKAALAFFIICVAKDFLDSMARRILVNFCLLATPLSVCYLITPSIDWQTGLLIVFSQYLFLMMAEYFRR
jgi:hypothetical protein